MCQIVLIQQVDTRNDEAIRAAAGFVRRRQGRNIRHGQAAAPASHNPAGSDKLRAWRNSDQHPDRFERFLDV